MSQKWKQSNLYKSSKFRCFICCYYSYVKAITTSHRLSSITAEVGRIVFLKQLQWTHTYVIYTLLPLSTARQFLTLDGQKARLRSSLKAHFAALCMSRNYTIMYLTVKRKSILTLKVVAHISDVIASLRSCTCTADVGWCRWALCDG